MNKVDREIDRLRVEHHFPHSRDRHVGVDLETVETSNLALRSQTHRVAESRRILCLGQPRKNLGAQRIGDRRLQIIEAQLVYLPRLEEPTFKLEAKLYIAAWRRRPYQLVRVHYEPRAPINRIIAYAAALARQQLIGIALARDFHNLEKPLTERNLLQINQRRRITSGPDPDFQLRKVRMADEILDPVDKTDCGPVAEINGIR